MVSIKENTDIEPCEFQQPIKILAVADIEGNFNGLVSFMQSNGVIDEAFNWCFGEGHFVMNGDLVDRGPFVTGVLWLCYKLEEQAKNVGGRMHVVLGNHDIMNIQGWVDYTHSHFKMVAKSISNEMLAERAIPQLFASHSELGRWLRSRNAFVKLGKHLFVHGGLSPELLQLQLSIHEINQVIRENIDQDFYITPSSDEFLRTVMGKKGPIWYRGLAKIHHGDAMATQAQVEAILDFYEGEKVIIGHTVVDDICSDYNNKVIKIDILHSHEKNSGKTKGILIENDRIHKIDDLGNQIEII